MIAILIASFMLLILAICYCLNTDIFSPVKFYFLYLMIFFLGIYIEPQKPLVYLVYVLYMLFGLIAAIVERVIIQDVRIRRVVVRRPTLSGPFTNEWRVIVLIFLVSSIPLFAQLYFIQIMGGLVLYIHSISLRVHDWAGKGYLILILRIFPATNLVFLILGLTHRLKHKKVWWSAYILHSCVLILLGFLSGSRSATLYVFLYALIGFNYWRRPIKVKTVVVFIPILLGLALVMGSIRNRLHNYQSPQNITSMVSRHFSDKTFNSGLIALNTIMDRSFTNYQGGLTFLAAFTNLIPRSLWKEKPDTGGVVLTKFMQGSEYAGTTNNSPGAIVEGVINFGYFFGLMAGFIILIVVMLVSMVIYRRLLLVLYSDNQSRKKLFTTFLYIITCGFFGGLLQGEFAAMIDGIIFLCVPYLFVRFFLGKSIRPNIAKTISNLEPSKG